jgi:uncharacterized protein (TIGR02722 family)
MNTPRFPKIPSLDQLPPLAPLLSIPLMAAAAFLPGCSPTRDVTRVDPNTTVDFSEKYNDSDARRIYESLVKDCLARPWIDTFQQENGGRRPVVIVGRLENKTQSYILDSGGITDDISRELINSGRVKFVAAKSERDQIREERIQGQEWSRPETRKQVKAETGADLIMIGSLIEDSQRALSGRQGVQFYKATLKLVDIETNQIVWTDSKEIKKLWNDR